MNTEARLLYQRVYAKVRHDGFSSEVACTKARDAVREATGIVVQPHDHRAAKVSIPPEVLADAERIKHLEHPLLIGRLMGDPLPGRSALDKLSILYNSTY